MSRRKRPDRQDGAIPNSIIRQRNLEAGRVAIALFPGFLFQSQIIVTQTESPIVVQIVTLGCAKNLVDAEVMCGTLAANGIYLTAERDEADLVIINTCAFILDARKEAEAAIKDALRWRGRGLRRGVLRAVAVGGCLPQRQPEQCAARWPDVDFFLGLDDIAKVADLIKSFFNGKLSGRNIPRACLPTYLYDHESPRLMATPGAYAYIKVAEGCDHHCAFCAIPGIRGRLRSRQPGSVVEECKQLLDMGVKEINFIAQDTSAYGRDLGGGHNLAELLRECDKLPGEFWLRVLYTHPAHITEELLQLLAGGGHVVPYLDMPLQHISTSILTAMRRQMDGPATRKLLAHIKEAYPNLILRTTMLTGFPGETEDDFQELCEFIQEIRFDRLGAFSFSPEEGTPAFDIQEGKVPNAVAVRRRNALLELQRQISLERNKSLIGSKVRVLLEEREGRKFVGRGFADAPEVDQRIVCKGTNLRLNDFADVTITSCTEYELRCEQ